MTELIRYGMKPKSIRKRLNEKLEAWIQSIEDLDVQQAVRDDVIVTGGSIASMLLGEKVNDYDVYFKTKDTTLAVARYYVQKFNEKKKIEVGEGVNPVYPEVREVTETNCKGEEENLVQIWIKSAGVASDEMSEYQYFELMPQENQDNFIDSIQQVTEEDGKYRPVFLSQNAITLSDSMQIVIRFYGSPEEIHNNYDFVHAMNYYDFKNQHLELKVDALTALMSRTLIYRGSLYPIATMFRIKKFLTRGWRISAGQILKVSMQISELNLKDFNTLKQQLTGVDAAYFHQILDAVKDVDPEKINSSYIAEIIDRVFGE
ncbi:hypothetical protein [Ralstonia phage RSP15]|uniref:hypothetical protein n=1 Tax=Ralstonia phage RSP15 TaxID=1785960 RepID=UPI00074D2E72|nr:hypothetical protein BH754_gp153 [Ralstonia phage RSP15]BAU40153.1 hypothetical protein [Ralstonia phage RSP15]